MPKEQPKLGTFLGVYLPTVLTILGVIMYLRVGWLVGHLGLGRALAAILCANAITLLTTLSFSSVATNARIGVAGAYFITSRSLGPAIGGAIGLPLFLSQTFSVTLYAFGLAESLRIIWPAVPVQTAAFLIVGAVAVLSYLGADLALRIQLPVLGLIGASLIALVMGVITKVGGQPIEFPTPSGEIPFWTGFAVFFPAVTGIMAGLGLSGDLKDPVRAIPRGAIAAVLTGVVVYLAVPVLLSISASPSQLREDPLVWTRIAPLGVWLILPGLWGAIFSSAVGSMLGAPRTFQALLRDRLPPKTRAARVKTSGRLALLPGFAVCVPIALGAVLLGNLNAVAPVVTMFFLTIYGTINLVAAAETLSGDPSWRPRLRVPWLVNLAGAAGCMAVMLLINPLIGLLAIAAEFTLWSVLSRHERIQRWGDARRGLYESVIRWALIRLFRRPRSPRNWRPHALVFVSDPVQQLDLVRFGDWFSQGRGVVTVCQLMTADLLSEEVGLETARLRLGSVLQEEKLLVFPEVVVVRDMVQGILSVTQSVGLATMDANLVLLGWPKERGLMVEFLRSMRRLERIGRSLAIGRIRPKHLLPRIGLKRTIHIWWGGMQRNGDLMLLLAYLLTRNAPWQRAEIEVLTVASNEMIKTQSEAHLAKLIPELRIDATVRVIMKPKEKSVREVIHETSADAELVIFGLATPERGEEAAYAVRLEELAGDLPAVFFVKNSSVFIGELVQPTSG